LLNTFPAEQHQLCNEIQLGPRLIGFRTSPATKKEKSRHHRQIHILVVYFKKYLNSNKQEEIDVIVLLHLLGYTSALPDSLKLIQYTWKQCNWNYNTIIQRHPKTSKTNKQENTNHSLEVNPDIETGHFRLPCSLFGGQPGNPVLRSELLDGAHTLLSHGTHLIWASFWICSMVQLLFFGLDSNEIAMFLFRVVQILALTNYQTIC